MPILTVWVQCRERVVPFMSSNQSKLSYKNVMTIRKVKVLVSYPFFELS